MIRRCPQCHTTCDDQYGFCIKCGYEFSKIDKMKNNCPLCNYPNPDEADFCVKCGSPLIFKHEFNRPPSSDNQIPDISTPHTSRVLIVLGYIFSILGGIIGLIIAIYLATRPDPVARKHGKFQLAIFVFYIILIGVFIATGALTMNDFTQYYQFMSGNMTNMTFL